MAQKVCGPKLMIVIIFDRNADPDPHPLKIFGGQIFSSFFHFWLHKI